jgi:hypothetical protein
MQQAAFTCLLLFAGTCDLKGRPLVVFDSTDVVKASLDSHQIASVLLYYSSLQRYQSTYIYIYIYIVSSVAGGPEPFVLSPAVKKCGYNIQDYNFACGSIWV